MISSKTRDILKNSSAIRAMFVEGKAMAEKYGRENVYDFSLGNPATPAPAAFNAAIRELTETTPEMELHGYMENAGFKDVRNAIADNLNSRFGTDFAADRIVMTVGAAGGLNVILKTILDPGDEVMVIAPFFSEYRQYVANFSGNLVVAASDPDTFMPDFEDISAKITSKTKGIIINTPNNPTGAIYGADTLKALGQLLEEKEREFGSVIYLISDEPYRELVYDGKTQPFVTEYYRDTLVAYSFSKSLSVPGERIGYIAVPAAADGAEELSQGLEVSNRVLGYVNAPSLVQKAVARCLEETPDVYFYDENRKLLYDALTSYGFSCTKPEGAFYLWVKSPVPNEEEFVNAGKEEHILMVKGSAFGCPGYVRIAYCVSKETVEGSLEAFKRLAARYF